MLTKLSNEYITVEISSAGAELHSIKNRENLDYLWNGDPKYWGRHAPVLFPIVGKVFNNEYKIAEDKFSLSQHGFARDKKFSIIYKDEGKITYSLDYNEDTLKIYPYKFQLKITYELIMNKVKVSYTVTNKDKKEIFFSIGAHPAFNCPLSSGEAFEDYYFEFSENENLEAMVLSSEGYLTRAVTPIQLKDKKLFLTKELFKNDALIFKDLNSDVITLKNKNNDKALEMSIKDFPYLGLWSPPKGAPFVCIEPWFGHADYEGFQGDFSEKEEVQSLVPRSEFNCSYTIGIL